MSTRGVFKFPPPLIPEKYANVRVRCHKCKRDFTPPWLTPLEKPLTPTKNGTVYGIPKSVAIPCGHCGEANHVALGPPNVAGDLFLYGDEAERKPLGSNLYLLLYAVVGGSPPVLESVRNEVRSLKSHLEPGRDPTSWRIHMSDLWSGHQRKKHEVFSAWAFDKVSECVRNLAAILNKHSKSLWTYSLVGRFDRRQLKSNRRAIDDCFSLLLLDLMDKITDKKGRPHFFFDQTCRAKSSSAHEGWADASFLGNQRSLLYAFVTGSTPVDRPTFLPPGSDPLLEMADLVAFVIARFLERKIERKNPDLSPQILGLATHAIYDPSQGLLWERTHDYPWERFFAHPQWS